MLRPQQVEDYAQRCAAAFDELELNILTDMARRIAKANYMTEGAKWQAERAEALGASRKHLADRMEKLMADAAPHVAVIFAQAMLEAEEQDNRFYRAAGDRYQLRRPADSPERLPPDDEHAVQPDPDPRPDE